MASYTFGYGGAYGYRGSLALAQILYQTSLGDFTYNTDSSGNVVLTNQGNLGTSYDGLPYSGRGIELGATNDVDIPIHHTLWNSTSTYSSSQEGTATPIADGVNIVVSAPTSGSTYPRTFFTLSNTITEGNTYLVSFDVVVNSGTVVNQGIYVGGGTSTQLSSGLGSLTTGHYEVEITVDYTVSDSTLISLSFDGFNNTFDVDITNLISEQITNPNSYLTYYDFTDGLVTLGNSVDGGSSKELVTNGNFDTDTDWTKGNGTNWTIANGKATNDGTNDWTLTQYNVFEVGKTYHVSFDIIDYTSGIVSLYVDSSFVFTVSSNGAYSTTITPKTSTSLTFYPRSTFIGSIDNVSVKEILPISTKYTLNSKTVNNVITHTTPWSASDWTKINNNPNLIGKLALETTGVTKTIPELDMVMDEGSGADSYYMCSEKDLKGSSIVDVRSVGLEEVINNSFDSGLTGYIIYGSPSVTSGVLTIDKNTSDLVIQDLDASIVSGVYTIIEVDIKSVIGTARVNRGASISTEEIRVTTPGIHSIVTKSGNNQIYINALGSTDVVEYNSVSVRKATATEIANYASTVRTNADLQQKGIQTTAFVTDGVGVPTSYSDNLLQFNGDGRYVDTQRIQADRDFTIEKVYKLSSSLSLEGTFEWGVSERLSIGTNTNIYIRVDVGSVNKIKVIDAGALCHVVVSFDSTLSTFDWYVNGIIVDASVATDFAGTGLGTYLIGKSRYGSYKADNVCGLFKVLDKKSTSAEVATAYAQAKAIYPTLP